MIPLCRRLARHRAHLFPSFSFVQTTSLPAFFRVNKVLFSTSSTFSPDPVSATQNSPQIFQQNDLSTTSQTENITGEVHPNDLGFGLSSTPQEAPGENSQVNFEGFQSAPDAESQTFESSGPLNEPQAVPESQSEVQSGNTLSTEAQTQPSSLENSTGADVNISGHTPQPQTSEESYETSGAPSCLDEEKEESMIKEGETLTTQGQTQQDTPRPVNKENPTPYIFINAGRANLRSRDIRNLIPDVEIKSIYRVLPQKLGLLTSSFRWVLQVKDVETAEKVLKAIHGKSFYCGSGKFSCSYLEEERFKSMQHSWITEKDVDKVLVLRDLPITITWQQVEVLLSNYLPSNKDYREYPSPKNKETRWLFVKLQDEVEAVRAQLDLSFEPSLLHPGKTQLYVI